MGRGRMGQDIIGQEGEDRTKEDNTVLDWTGHTR